MCCTEGREDPSPSFCFAFEASLLAQEPVWMRESAWALQGTSCLSTMNSSPFLLGIRYPKRLWPFQGWKREQRKVTREKTPLEKDQG